MKFHQSICPRNCYDTCSIISTTHKGVLISVEGNPHHEYTSGKLCPKALDDVKKVYSPQRIRYPMRQRGRYSGFWERISWDEALTLIAEKILSLKETYGSSLPLALNKYSGNFGVLHNAMEGLFTGIGATTRTVGSPCWSAGVEAQTYDFGTFFCSDPLDMAKANLIWLWGVNPAWTAVHQMPIIFDAIDGGAKVVCFDTHFSATAARAHRYVQVRPGTDGLLALGFAKVLLEENLIDSNLSSYTLGHEEFFHYLENEISLDNCSEITGVSISTIRELALEYGKTHPACIWAGFGLQRYTNGGQTLRAIDALGALAGHLGEQGGGVQYAQFQTWRFSGAIQNPAHPFNISSNTDHPSIDSLTQNQKQTDRLLNINRFSEEALSCTDPPVKILWISGRNPLSQDGNLQQWKKLINQLDLIVVNDLFHSKSSEAADLFLPITTHYEHWDLNAGYWHYWVGVNEPAILPIGESRSDIQIAWDVSSKLNELEPGSCIFPTSGDEKETLLRELGPQMLDILGLKKPEEILKAPVRANFPSTAWENRIFATPSGRYEFFSSQASNARLSPLPIFVPPLNPSIDAPLRLLTPHHYSTINSQVYASGADNSDYVLHLAPELAQRHNLAVGDRAQIWNKSGLLEVVIQPLLGISADTVIIFQEQVEANSPLNCLIGTPLTDMGQLILGAPGFALNETFVNLRKL
ncbi:molybdopterin-dependent oxidoreductase [Desulfosporosinus shakirovi]|uniref:molybdopterin-dependent oxidoreductase n=1 Tax=Desulfosporosinus shakirovi TaxID=2885154 RepID=UPI001E37DEDC|nr:molybdopterin-dependent oxidoreductase [Desulfosporosinus sp. SRJS8]MCB8816991.1 molybdopterin-dependent oxidoreductase [Desulfosporosinus sp. SRJS8]